MNIDPNEIFKNLQNVQEQMKDMQAQLSNVTETGSAGGDLVEVVINGHFEVQKVKIDPLCVDKRDIPMLEELVQSAFEGAVVKIKERIKTEFSSNLGMPFPGQWGM